MSPEPNQLAREHYRLIRAAYRGDLDQLNLLLEEGIDLELKNLAGLTALHFAAAQGRVLIVKRLIEAGADTSARTIAGYTAEELAHINGQEEVVFLFDAFPHTERAFSRTKQ